MSLRIHRIRRVLAILIAGLLLGIRPGFAASAPTPPAERTLVFFGDSLTEGYGLDDPDAQSFPARIQQKIRAARLPWKVVNAGLSGETSAGGLRRVDWILKQRIDVFFLALGANDGLRGTPPETTRRNLQALIDVVKRKDPDCRIILAGMQMPTTMGPEYTKAYQALFPRLAKANGVLFMPFLLEGVAGNPALNQQDAMHPNAQGAAVVADNVWTWVEPLLEDKDK